MSQQQSLMKTFVASAMAVLGSFVLTGCGTSANSRLNSDAALSFDSQTRQAAHLGKEAEGKDTKPSKIKTFYRRYNFCLAGAGESLISFDGYIATFRPRICNVVDYTIRKTESAGATTYSRAIESRLYEGLHYVLDMRNPTASNQEPQPQLLMDPLSPLVGPLSPLIGLPAYNPNVNTGNYTPGDLAYFDFFTKLLDEKDKRRVFEKIESLARTVLAPTKTLLSFLQLGPEKDAPPTPNAGHAVAVRMVKILQGCSQVQAAWNTPVPPPPRPNPARPERGPHSNFKIFGLSDGLPDHGTGVAGSDRMRIRPDTSIPELCGNPSGWVQ